MTILVCKTNSLCCGSQHQACILHVQKQNAKMKDKNKCVIEEVNTKQIEWYGKMSYQLY